MVHYNRNINLIIALLLPVLSFLLGWNLSQQNQSTDTNKPKTVFQVDTRKVDTASETFLYRQKKEKEVDLSVFWEAWNQLENNFLENSKLDIQEQVYGATRGLVSSLEDPYTVFMDPEASVEFEESMSGEFEGIGAEIGFKENQIVIVTPIKGSPAEKAGVQSGDVIFKVNDETTQGLSIQEVVTRIRGPKGEKVDLTLLREGENEPVQISIVRDKIIIKSVEWELRDGVAVVEISQFGNDVLREFREAMAQILLENPRGMVLDLRNNGGGLMDACVEIASEFLDRKLIVQTQGRTFGNTAELVARSGGSFVDTPLIVLINEGSASASEIFAGAMQDHERALLIGEKSFGKGSVQHVIPLSDGSSIKITIAQWLTPNGNSIEETGITPDIEVQMTREQLENDQDPVMDKALEVMKNASQIANFIKEGQERRAQIKE